MENKDHEGRLLTRQRALRAQLSARKGRGCCCCWGPLSWGLAGGGREGVMRGSSWPSLEEASLGGERPPVTPQTLTRDAQPGGAALGERQVSGTWADTR